MATLRIIFLMTISVSLADNQVSVTELLKKVSNLETKLKTLEAETNLNRYKLDTVESQIVEQANQVSVFRGMSAQSMNEVRNLENKVGAGTALFSVYTTEAVYPTPGQVIPFRGETLNQGGHYSVSTYKFRCPKRGYYFFTFSILSTSIKWGTSYFQSNADLVLDGHTVAQASSWTHDPDHYMGAQGSNSVVVECPQGGQVWLKGPWGNNGIYGYSNTTKHSTFSGFLLSNL